MQRAFVTIRPDVPNAESELVAAVAGIGEQDITVAADTSAAEAPSSRSRRRGRPTVQHRPGRAGPRRGHWDKIDETTSSTNTLGDQHRRPSGMGGPVVPPGGAASALGSSAVAGGAAAAACSRSGAGLEARAAQRFDFIAGPMAEPARLHRRGRPVG